MEKSGIVLIKEFFGDVRPVTMDEMKALTAPERAELADAIAKQLGFERVEENAKVLYRKAS